MTMAEEEEDVHLSSKLEHIEEKSTQFSEVADELDVSIERMLNAKKILSIRN